MCIGFISFVRGHLDMGRAPCCEKVGLRRGRWTAEEDEILTNYIQINGEGSWRSLPKNAGLLRCGKSCRLRWINYLRSDLKRGNITAEEETLIIKLHTTMGNRWSLIAGHLPGRTDNEIKNYWNSHLSRKIHTITRRRPADDNHTPSSMMDLGNKTDGVIKKRRGGRTSRSAMKKTKEYRTTHKLPGVAKLPPHHPPPWQAPKDAHKTTSSPVAIMPETPTIDKEKSLLYSAISWPEEDLEAFFTESYNIDDVLLLANNEEVECDMPPPNKEKEEENGEIIRCFSGIMDVDDDEINNREKMQFGALNSCFAESREVLDNSSETLAFEDENLQSLGLVGDKKMAEEGSSETIEPGNSFFTLSPSENQENGNLGFWCPTSPVLSTMVNDEGQIRSFDILEEGDNVDSAAGGNEEGILSWLWDTSPYEGKCYNQDGDKLLDVDKQNAMVAWLLS